MASFLSFVQLNGSVSAATLSQRKLAILDALPSAVTTHDFTFSYASSDPIAAVSFEYCTSPLIVLVCDAPAGLDASTAVLSGQSGETGFIVTEATANRLVLSRPVPAVPAVNPSQYTFDTITNPADIGPFYVRITTHASSDASDPAIDFGAVVNATTQGVTISTEVPPILKFCVGLTVDMQCQAIDGNLVDLGTLSATNTASGNSQMLAGTNAEFGLAIAVYGTTLTSGTNTITALANPTPSAPGNSQFGLNLRENSSPDSGQEPIGIGVANPSDRYNTANRYAFVSGDVVATSPVATDLRLFTSTYIANITPAQTPGVYTATLTYVCTATF